MDKLEDLLEKTVKSTSSKKQYRDNTEIEDVIRMLKEKSKVGIKGMYGEEVRVEKALLRLAAVYLEDYLFCMGKL